MEVEVLEVKDKNAPIHIENISYEYRAETACVIIIQAREKHYEAIGSIGDDEALIHLYRNNRTTLTDESVVNPERKYTQIRLKLPKLPDGQHWSMETVFAGKSITLVIFYLHDRESPDFGKDLYVESN